MQLLKQEDKFPELKILKDLSVSSIIQFCHDYMSYRSGLGAPQPIQKCMSEKVRENLVSSPQGVDWGLQSTTDLDTATSDQVVSLLQDYCTPENPRDFYNKLEAATGFPPMSIKYLVGLKNFLFFHEK